MVVLCAWDRERDIESREQGEAAPKISCSLNSLVPGKRHVCSVEGCRKLEQMLRGLP